MTDFDAEIAADVADALDEVGEDVTYTPHDGSPSTVTAKIHRTPENSDGGQAASTRQFTRLTVRLALPDATYPDSRDKFSVGGVTYSVESFAVGVAFTRFDLVRRGSLT